MTFHPEHFYSFKLIKSSHTASASPMFPRNNKKPVILQFDHIVGKIFVFKTHFGTTTTFNRAQLKDFEIQEAGDHDWKKFAGAVFDNDD